VLKRALSLSLKGLAGSGAVQDLSLMIDLALYIFLIFSVVF